MAGSSELRIDVDSEIDRLYQSPLAEFVAARKALAKRIRQAGDRQLATRVKTLGKPSVSAWAVNQVFWRHPEAFEGLVDSGQRVRDAQDEGAAAVREASGLRRDAVAKSLRLAERILREAGNAAGPNILKRVETSFESLAAYGRSQPDPPAGRLIEDVAPPGFEALAGMSVNAAAGRRPGGKGAKPPPAARESKLDLKQAELVPLLTKAFREMEALGKEVAAATTARDRARSAAERESLSLEAARQRWLDSVRQLGEADDRAREAARRWQEAAARLADAEAAAEELRKRLSRGGANDTETETDS